MIILSLIFLTIISINIFSSSVQKENIDAYMKDIEKQLSEELKIIK